MIGKKAEAILNRGVKLAIDMGHEFFTIEHVLSSLLEEAEIRELVSACGGNVQGMSLALREHLQTEVPEAAPVEGKPEKKEHPVATLAIQRLIQRALFHVQSAGKDEISPSDLFVALFQCKDSHALYLIQKEGIDRLDVLNYVSHGIRKDESGSEPTGGGEDSDSEVNGAGGKNSSQAQDPLKLYAENLNERAKQGRIDPIVGRQTELDRMVQILCRRRKNNPLLVGEAGVGKTALAEGLALRVTEGAVPELLANVEVYSLDLGSLLAGAKFRGDFEQRLKQVLQALQKRKEKGFEPVLFIDEIHTLIGAGAVSGGVMDAANLLKPMLARGELRCIGSTTYAEYRTVFEKDHALSRRFQKIDVVEPTADETIRILEGLKAKFETHHHVRYSPEVIRLTVELAGKHLTDRFQPDKSIDLLDEVGARIRLREYGKNQTNEAASVSAGESNAEPRFTEVAPSDVEEVIAQVARIPARAVTTSQKDRLQNLERDLKLMIFGQDQAIESIVTSIRLARSGLRSGEKPIGSFLLAGPTGVGKTELSRQLAHALGVPLVRFDMSEYSERHTISRLIGAPPGYVGFEQQGLLTDALLKNPHSVVLLDEIEKAHPEIWNILLQVMDHGFLTDNNGRKADFRNAVLLMTSNVGSREMERKPLGFGGGQPLGQAAAQKAIEQAFTPEFRNRLDGVIHFNPLDPVTIAQVVGKQLLELESQLLAKNIELEVSPDVRSWLAEKGYDRLMGARPMGRLIQDRIKKQLANEILFGVLENGGRVIITIREGEPHFEFVAKAGVSTPGESTLQTV